MPRFLQNLRERAIGMLNDGMTTNSVAVNTGCSTWGIRHLRRRFQATGRTEDRPHIGRPRVMACCQDSYTRNTHLLNRFQTARAIAAKTHGTHNNRLSAQTVHMCIACAMLG